MTSKNPKELDRRFLWHPSTPLRPGPAGSPLVIERADGNYLIDSDGRRYLDGGASLGLNLHGHRHPAINAAIVAQLDRFTDSSLLGLSNTPSIRLAERLVDVAPRGLTRVLFSDSGATAIEVALKIAYEWQQLGGRTERTRFLALEGAHHGDLIASAPLERLTRTILAPPDTEAVVRAIDAHADEICAVVLEPLVQAAAGMRLMPRGLFAAAAAACRRHGVLLIADEVATGFGRMGTLFACEQEDVTPDLMVVAQGLSGGYPPVAATLATDAIFDRFLGAPTERLTFFQGHGSGGNPVGCAAALASLDLFARDRVVERLAQKVTALEAALARHVAPLPHVFEIRQRGLMVGIELRRDRIAPYPAEAAIGAQVCHIIRKHGVVLRPLGPVVMLTPPLSITAEEIEHLVQATAAAIGEATQPDAPLPRRITPPPPSRPPGFFVLGTDTGVGKTAVASALLRLARRRGGNPVPSKPVETGCGPTPADALALRVAADRPDLPIDRICPHPFPAPIAPAAAAARAGVSLDRFTLLAAVERARGDGNFLVVESAGGLLTPYGPALSGADLAEATTLPALLVARNALGTINHTALAVAELRRRAIPLAGILLVETTPDVTPDREDNAALIEAATGIRPAGPLRFVSSRDPDALADALVRDAPQIAALVPSSYD